MCLHALRFPFVLCASCAGAAAGCVVRGVLCNNAVCWCTARAVWSPSLQLACDVLRGGVPLGSGRSQVRLWWHVAAAAACGRSGRSRGVLFRQPNCLWQIQTSGKMLSLPLRLRRALRESLRVCRRYPDAYPVPRFACGAFVDCLSLLFTRATGGAKLHVTSVGKPLAPTFACVACQPALFRWCCFFLHAMRRRARCLWQIRRQCSCYLGGKKVRRYRCSGRGSGVLEGLHDWR